MSTGNEALDVGWLDPRYAPDNATRYPSSLFGNKGRTLADLVEWGHPVPPGFAVTMLQTAQGLTGSPEATERITHGFRIPQKVYKNLENALKLQRLLGDHAVSHPEITEHIEYLIRGEDDALIDALREGVEKARTEIGRGAFGPEEEQSIRHAYRHLSETTESRAVIVRSSSPLEDTAESSAAGMFATYPNVCNEDDLLDAVRRVMQSEYSADAIYQRMRDSVMSGGPLYLPGQENLAVVVMSLIEAEASGTAFTLDVGTGLRNVTQIQASYGPGAVVGPGAEPDTFLTYENGGTHHIIKRVLGEKPSRNALAPYPGGFSPEPITDGTLRERYALSDDVVQHLAASSHDIESRSGRPMDIEWALDEDGSVWIVQARPETYHAQKDIELETRHEVEDGGIPPLAEVDSVGVPGAFSGRRVFIQNPGDPKEWEDLPAEGIVAEVEELLPADVPHLANRAEGAIVRRSGADTGHAAILWRQSHKSGAAGVQLPDDLEEITIDTNTGQARIYDGVLPIRERTIDYRSLPETRTKTMINIATPFEAMRYGPLDRVEGFGVVRQEVIGSQIIQAHPLAFLYPERLDHEQRTELERMSVGFPSMEEAYIGMLSGSLAQIAAGASSDRKKQVIHRLSDWRIADYRARLGGGVFQADDDPDFRGAALLASEGFREAMMMDLEAIRRVRQNYGFDNFNLMVPFVRDIGDFETLLGLMEDAGLRREDGLKVYAMFETIENTQHADELITLTDGYSVGSNDLVSEVHQLDRNLYHGALLQLATHPQSLDAFRIAVETAHRHNKYAGFCGHAATEEDEVLKELVHMGFDSISVTPDALYDASKVIHAAEPQHAGR